MSVSELRIVMLIQLLSLSLAIVPSLESLLLLLACKCSLPTKFAIHGQVTKWCFLFV